MLEEFEVGIKLSFYQEPINRHSPERELLLHVLLTAIQDTISEYTHVRNETNAWLRSRKISPIPLSFNYICLHLNLDPDKTQEQIEALAMEDIRGIRSKGR